MRRASSSRGSLRSPDRFTEMSLAAAVAAASAIKPHYEKYRQLVETESATGIPDDVVFGPIPYHAYFVACGALLKYRWFARI